MSGTPPQRGTFLRILTAEKFPSKLEYTLTENFIEKTAKTKGF